jgi:DNA-binding NtrC family response regulator
MKSKFEQSADRMLENLSDSMTCLEMFNNIVSKKCHPKGSRIFICDDDRVDRMHIRNALEPMGYQLVFGSSGQEFVDVIKANDIGMLVTDLGMPGMDSLEIIEQISKLHVPVIVVTGMPADAEEVIKLKEMKIEVFHKPANLDRIVESILVNFGDPR